MLCQVRDIVRKQLGQLLIIPSLGIFFDLNPARRRDLFDSPCHHYVRISYGPVLSVLEQGMNGIERVLQKNGAYSDDESD